jgi:hypothetical protein
MNPINNMMKIFFTFILTFILIIVMTVSISAEEINVFHRIGISKNRVA